MLPNCNIKSTEIQEQNFILIALRTYCVFASDKIMLIPINTPTLKIILQKLKLPNKIQVAHNSPFYNNSCFL